MAGDSSLIENEEERKESEQWMNDHLLVSYFSMFYMQEIKKLMQAMLKYAKKANYSLLLI